MSESGPILLTTAEIDAVIADPLEVHLLNPQRVVDTIAHYINIDAEREASGDAVNISDACAVLSGDELEEVVGEPHMLATYDARLIVGTLLHYMRTAVDTSKSTYPAFHCKRRTDFSQRPDPK